jgi:hypothetical protein
MLDLAEDLSTVFYGPDFTAIFTRQRPAVVDVQVAVIIGVADADALDGRAIATTRTVLMPATADVKADDVMVAVQEIPGTGITAGQRFKVLDVPRRVVDGMEMEALLGSVPA